MSSVDDRIVNMQFNNKQFSSGAADAQKSLQGLEGALAKTATSPGLNQLADGVQKTTSKFGAMQVAGVAAIATIASKATSAGLNLVKSFTIDPLKAGFAEYQTNLKSTQTIIANTGKPLGIVNKSLDELNRYSDETIYNFSQMAASIGKFTAAGVPLKDATTSIKGMANAAALGGASVEQMNSAMYQVSQALATGTIKLMDWNSIVNANMGGKNMQKSLIATAKTLGKPVDEAIAKQGSFRDSLTEGWLTADVFNKSMKVMAGTVDEATGKTRAFSKAELEAMGYTKQQAIELNRLSGAAIESATKIKSLPQLFDVMKESVGSLFAGVFRNLIGDLNEAKSLFTFLGDVLIDNGIAKIGNYLNGKNGILTLFNELGGRADVIAGLRRVFLGFRQVLGTIGKAFREVFPPASIDTILGMAKAFRGMFSPKGLNPETLENIKNIFKGVFAVLHIGFVIVKGIIKAFGAFFGAIFSGSGEAGGSLLELLGNVGQIIAAFDKWFTAGGNVEKVIAGVGATAGAALKPFLQTVGAIISALVDLSNGTGSVDAVLAPFKQAKDDFGAFLAMIGDGFAYLSGPLQAAGGLISDFVGKIDSLTGGKLSGGIDIGENIVKGIAGGFSSAWGFLKAQVELIGTNIITWIKERLGIHSPSQEMIPIGFNILMGIGEGILNGLRALGTFVAKAFGMIVDLFKWAFEDMEAIDVASLFNAFLTGAVLININRMFGALRDIAGSFGGIGMSASKAIDQLTSTLKTMQNSVRGEMIRNIAIAVALLTASLIALTFVEPKKLGIALGAMSTMFGMLIVTMKQLAKVEEETSMAKLAGSIFLISSAMIALATAVAIFGNMDYETLGKGLGAMAIALTIMTKAVMSMASQTTVIKGGAAAIFIMSAAMIVLATAVLAFGKQDLGTLAKGLGAVAIGMNIMTTAVQRVSNMEGVGKAALAITLMATSMLILATAVAIFGNMDLKTLAVGFGAVALGLGIFIVALTALGKLAPTAASSAASILIMSKAMLVLAGVFVIMGALSWETIGKGFTFVAGALLLFIAAAAAITYLGLAPALGALAAIVLALGQAMAWAGAGFLAFSAGLAILVALGAAGIAVITLAIQAFIAMLPSIALQMAAAFVAFVEVIAKASPRLRAAFGTILRNILGTIRDAIPEFRKLFQALLDAGIQVVRDTVPDMITAAFEIIDAFLTEVDNNLEEFIDRGGDIIANLITGLGQQGEKITTACGEAILSFLENLRDAIDEYGPQIRDVGLQIAGKILDGMTGGLASKAGGALKDGLGAAGGFIKGDNNPLWRTAAPRQPSAGVWGNMIAPSLIKAIGTNAAAGVNSAITMANSLLTEGNKSAKPEVDRLRRASISTDRAEAEAQALRARAAKTPKGKRRQALLDRADSMDARADARQTFEDKKREELQRKLDFDAADVGTKAEMRSEDATRLADEAQRKLAQADANAKQAQELMKTNRKAGRAMMAQARKDAKAAAELARQARVAYAEAQRLYTQEVNDRIKAIQEAAAADKKAREDEAAFEAADQAGKIAILENRAAEAQAKADAANLEMENQIKIAQANANTNQAVAMTALDEAERQAEIAKAAADAAEQARDQAEQLKNPSGGTTGGGGTSGPIMPSRDVLESAASVVDRYSASLAAATEAAGATPTTVQYVQNNYSPEALSVSDVYRQTNNLLSAQEVKMGVK